MEYKKRYKKSKKQSQRSFRKGAMNIHPKNNMSNWFMRGGIRL